MRFAKQIAMTLVAAASTMVQAAPATITSYDVSGAQLSGFGSWSHTYFGSISGTTYTNGSGTLNDGIVPSSEQNNQLFLFGDTPVITLHLSESIKVNTIDILGGITPSNAIPGTLKGWSVTIGDMTANLTSVGSNNQCYSGLCDDRVSLVGTGLDEILTQTIVLSHFEGVGGSWPEYFSAAEIVVNSPVPEAEAYAMVASGLCLVFLAAGRRQRRPGL